MTPWDTYRFIRTAIEAKGNVEVEKQFAPAPPQAPPMIVAHRVCVSYVDREAKCYRVRVWEVPMVGEATLISSADIFE